MFAFGAVGICIGVWLNLNAERYTRFRAKNAAGAAKRHANRPAVLRPPEANARPTRTGTRLTGVGFISIGLFGIVAALTGNGPR